MMMCQHFSGQTVYQLKQSLLDDYLIQQLRNPALKMVVAQVLILKIIAARNEQEALVGSMILDFDSKIKDFFGYVQTANEGERLIVKIKSQASEAEIYDDFAKLYRRYRALNRQKVGDYFFKEMDDLVDKLCDDFEAAICLDN